MKHSQFRIVHPKDLRNNVYDHNPLLGWEFIQIVRGSEDPIVPVANPYSTTAPIVVPQVPPGTIVDLLLFGKLAEADALLIQIDRNHSLARENSDLQHQLNEERKALADAMNNLTVRNSEYEALVELKKKTDANYDNLEKLYKSAVSENKKLKKELEEANKELKPINFEATLLPIEVEKDECVPSSKQCSSSELPSPAPIS